MFYKREGSLIMQGKRITLLILATVLVMALFTTTAYAGDNPVSLDVSSIEDGQTDVPVDTSIELTFTNNVVNMSVRDNNMACFTLLRDGTEVDIDVVMADDQIHPELKRIITIVPKSALQEGKTYQLVISGNLTAKNGNSIGSDTIIAFTTQGAVSYTWYIVGGIVIVCAAAAIILYRKKNGK